MQPHRQRAGGAIWTQLGACARSAEDAGFLAAFLAVKRANKQRLAARIRAATGIKVDADSLFDVQVKRIHEYKRQLLNLLHVVARYHAILDQPEGPAGAAGCRAP
jgi:glycogen phosphorylase